jgi:hypothetical protein
MTVFARLSMGCLLFFSIGLAQAANLAPVAPTGLTLSDPAYDCATRQLTIRASGGNGSPIEYMVAGQSRWSTSPTVVLEAIVAADAAPITLLARQANGGNAPEVASRSFSVATVCGGDKGNNTPKVYEPAKSTGLSLNETSFNCGTGQLTIQTAGGNGAGIEYMVAGQSRWESSASFTLEPAAVSDVPVLMVLARQQSETGTPYIVKQILDLGARCGGSKATPPATDATPTGITMNTPTYDCTTRTITIQTTGGNGNPVEYLVVGQSRWTSSASAVIDGSLIADNGMVMVLARQKNAQGVPTNVQQSVNTRTLCGGR